MVAVVMTMVTLSRSGAERTGNRKQGNDGEDAASNLLHKQLL